MIFLAVTGAASVTLCAGSQGHALCGSQSPPQGYLLRVGPPNLRFESAGPPGNMAAPTRFPLTESKPATMEIPPLGNAADAVKMPSAPTNAVSIAPVVVPAESISPSPNLNAANFAPSQTDPTIVTPGMLADYLKPSSPGKNNNSPSVVVPVNLGFTPPTAAPAPENSSRAVYKNE